MTHGRWLNAAAYGTWLVCGLLPAVEALRGSMRPGEAAIFFTAFAIFGAGLVLILHGSSILARAGAAGRLGVLLVESVTGLTMVYLSRNGTSAAILVLVAAGAPYLVSSATAWRLVVVNALAVGVIFALSVNWLAAISAGVAIGGFQLFALATSFLTISERGARERLASANAELLAARSLLEESSRLSERVRIARDLHDTLGHHLTALSIQLDVASRLTSGDAAAHVQQAHAVARLLLGDVRAVVSEMRDSQMDLAAAIRALASAPGPLRIHLDMPDAVAVDDTAQANALLRCVQEIITNASRHGGARNLWIRVAATADGVDLHARDDGRGTAQVRWGNGLKGMRERFEEHSGRVEVRSSEGHGFEVHGFMPRAEAAS